MTSALELRQVSKIYGSGPTEVRALCDVDLSVERGELVAIMGPSGSGKSALLTIAGSLEEATSGEVLVDGVDLASVSRSQRAQDATPVDRLGLSGLQPARRADGDRERHPAARLDGLGPRAARAAGLRGDGAARRRRTVPSATPTAVRRRAPTGSDRPSDHRRTPAAARRRADRRAGLRLGRRVRELPRCGPTRRAPRLLGRQSRARAAREGEVRPAGNVRLGTGRSTGQVGEGLAAAGVRDPTLDCPRRSPARGLDGPLGEVPRSREDVRNGFRLRRAAGRTTGRGPGGRSAPGRRSASRGGHTTGRAARSRGGRGCAASTRESPLRREPFDVLQPRERRQRPRKASLSPPWLPVSQNAS